MGVGGRVRSQFDVIRAAEMPARFENGPVDHDVGAAVVVDVDAEVHDGSDLGDVEGGIRGISDSDELPDYERVAVSGVKMNGGTGGGGAVRQNVRYDPFEFAAGCDFIHAVASVGESGCYDTRATPGVQVGGAASGR